MANPSPVCTVNTASTINGVNVQSGTTVTIALASTAGVNTWSITCIGTDENNTVAAINSSLTINSAAKTATFVAPAKGSALIFQSQVNSGLDITTSLPSVNSTTTFGTYVLTTDGKRVGAVNETFENNATYGWLTKLNDVIRNGATGGQVVNVKSPLFGAKGDGVTDDTAAIIAACASISSTAAIASGTVFFPPGIYMTTGLNLNTYAGLRLVGSGSYFAYPYGATVIRAIGSQNYVVRSAINNAVYTDITFDGNNYTTQAVVLLEYFTNQTYFKNCCFIRTSWNSTPTLGANLVQCGDSSNLEVDDTVFENCVIGQDFDNPTHLANAAVYLKNANTYLVHFRNTRICLAYYGVYCNASGGNFYQCDYENIGGYSHYFDMSVIQQPFWITECFTECAVPFIYMANPTQNSSDPLYIINNHTSTYPNYTLHPCRPILMIGNNLPAVNVSTSGGGRVVAIGNAFKNGADFTGTGATSNVDEFGTILDTGSIYAPVLSARSRVGSNISFGANPSTNGALNASANTTVLAHLTYTTAVNQPIISLDTSDNVTLAGLGGVELNAGVHPFQFYVNGAANQNQLNAPLVGYTGNPLVFGRNSVSVAGGANVTLTGSQYNTQIVEFTGAITANIQVILPVVDGWQKTFFNNTTGAFTLTVIGASGTGVVVGSGKRAILYCNGTNIVRVTPDT